MTNNTPPPLVGAAADREEKNYSVCNAFRKSDALQIYGITN